MAEDRNRIIIGISGASGICYGVRLLEMLQQVDIETHLVMSRSAKLTLGYEMDMSVAQVTALADYNHSADNIGAVIASGSVKSLGMLIVPCSIRSMSEIATGVTSSLLTRAADVVLKERRKLVLMVRETPLHTGHLRTMTALSEMGAIIAPPVPAMYTKPESITDMIGQTVGRLLDLYDIDIPELRRWNPDRR